MPLEIILARMPGLEKADKLYTLPWLAENIVVHAYLRISMPIPSWRQSSWEPIIWTLCWAEDNNWVPDRIFLYSICTYTAFFSAPAYTYKLTYIKTIHRLHLEEKAAWSLLCSTVSHSHSYFKRTCLMITGCSTVSHSHSHRLEMAFWWSPWSTVSHCHGPCH